MSISRFISDESGASAFEYVFIVFVIVFGLILAMQNLGPVVAEMVKLLSEALGYETPTS